ncbi:MAG: tRNA (adenosine(37)-N6)-dimethylallyltransferase MiaA [bacterium]
MSAKPKLIVILGPTAVGKSDLAVELAKDIHGEIVSADSRQIYRGMTIGTGKITKKEMLGVPHHLLDIVEPMTEYNVTKYQRDANKAIKGILERQNTPIICGGTGFYIQAVINDVVYPSVKPNKILRAKLEKKTLTSLLRQLERLDKKTFDRIDKNNKVKIVRALEIVLTIGSVPPVQTSQPYNVLQIGVIAPDEVLKERIYKRLIKRLKVGMLREIRKLHDNGVSWKRMEGFGLEYRYLTRYLTGQITKDQMIEQLNSAIWQYARRQKGWFRRDRNIQWFELKDKNRIAKLIRKFMTKK